MFIFSILLSFLISVKPVSGGVTGTISGYWVGETTQDGGGGYRSQYEIEMHLSETNGKVTGKAFSKVDDIYAEMIVAGTFEDGLVLSLKDIEIYKTRVNPGMEWCLKTYTLLLKKEDKEWFLEGHWHGKTSFSTCTPGKVLLRKGVYRV